jgi:phosphoglycerate kinase
MLGLHDLDLKGKTVFLRVDFNVPLDDRQNIRDDTRIKATLPTLHFLMEREARVIAASHLGRPKGKFISEFSLKPVADRLSDLIQNPVILAPDVIGPEVDSIKAGLKNGQVLILENLRFYAAETDNDADFARELAGNVDCYVNDAFGACHRAHASVVGIPALVKKAAAGFLIEKELKFLNRIIHSPEKPYIAILGGAKVSDKIPVIKNLLNKADSLLIGGAMAYTFYSAKGFEVGRSLVEGDKKGLALEILQEAEEKKIRFQLPLDHVIARSMQEKEEIRILNFFPIPPDFMALDIGPLSIAVYSNIIQKAKTILWNGPMGVFEIEQFSLGTTQIAKAVADSQSLSVVGGGDSVAAVDRAGVSEKISHISTGGGASLEYIANETLPGIEALAEK